MENTFEQTSAMPAECGTRQAKIPIPSDRFGSKDATRTKSYAKNTNNVKMSFPYSVGIIGSVTTILGDKVCTSYGACTFAHIRCQYNWRRIRF